MASMGFVSDTDQRTFNVAGMSCEHCVAAVDAEVSAVPGVSSVDVDLDSGLVVVHGPSIDGEAIRSAVQAAGYDLAENA
jgi:copper chaperone